MNFRVVEVRPYRKNTLQGFCTLLVDNMFEIDGFTYHEKGDKSWVGFPSKEYLDKETGEKKYAPIIKIEDKELYWDFQKAAREECRRLLDSEDLPESF